jgi:ABC-type Fe3+/spermidine/putrescine transport system ATPase subunit
VDKSHIELKGITKRFGEFTALEDVSLSIPKGNFITLLGPSGCGKTTLLRVLAGFYQQDAGEVYINGENISGLPPEKRGTPLVFQDYALFPHMTLAENVSYGLRLRKHPFAEIRKRTETMLAMFSLTGLENHYPRQLSGGQQQRAAFARALILERDILLLDEPLSNLDAKLRIEVRAQLRRIQRQNGITVVYVTHDQEGAMAMSDFVAVMRRGRILQTATPEELYHRPVNAFVANFIGAANLIPVEQCSRNGNSVEFSLFGFQSTATVAGHGSRMIALIRPEHITLCDPEKGDITGIIEERTFQGKTVQYRIRIHELLLLVEAFNANYEYPVNTKAGLWIDRSRLHVLAEEETENEKPFRFEHSSLVDKRRIKQTAAGIGQH